MIATGKTSAFRLSTKPDKNLLLLPYMVSVFAAFVITLYLSSNQGQNKSAAEAATMRPKI